MAWTILSTVDGYARYEEDLTLPDSGGAVEATIESSNLLANPSNTKFGVQVTVTETAAGDGALDVRLQGSVDGSNWENIDTSAAMDVDTTGTNTDVGTLDASGFFLPYWRLQVFSDGTDTQDSCDITVTVAIQEVHVIRTI